MKKTFLISLLGSVVLIFVLFIAFSGSSETETSKSPTATTSEVVNITFPTFDKLVELEGPQIEDLGLTQISSVVYLNKNVATLEPESHDPINLSLTIVDKVNNEFALPNVKYTPNTLQVGDTFGLAKKGSHYFAYRQN